jgi:hypothetical protein
LLCRRICIATRGCTSRAASKEPQVFRVPCTVITGTFAAAMQRLNLYADYTPPPSHLQSRLP